MRATNATLGSLITFEEQRLGLGINWRRTAPSPDRTVPFRPVIEICGPRGAYRDKLLIPQDGELIEVTATAGPTGKGEDFGFSHEEDFYKIGAIDGRFVYLTFDIDALFNNPPDGLNLNKLFEAIAGGMLNKAKDYIDSYAHEDEARRYVAWNLAGFEEQQSRWRVDMRDNEYELDRAHTTIVNLLRKNRDLRDMLNAANQVTKATREEMSAKEFAAIRKMMPNPICAIELVSGELRLETTEVTIDYNGIDYELGRFTIHLGSDRVRIYSVEGRAWPHPHINEDGVVCWGSVGTHVARLQGEREHAALVAVIVEFLHSYNEDDAYRNIRAWGDDPDYDE